MPDISKINALAIGSVSKVDGLAKASILDIDGVAVPSAVAPPLDTYTGAAAAYSVRLLRTAYTGDIMRVRRDSDQNEIDVGFDSNDEFGLTSPVSNATSGGPFTDFADFIGHGGTPANGFCRYWYDQSGNAVDAGQATQTSQPKIYDSSTGIIEEGAAGKEKPALDFDGTNDFFDVPSTQWSNGQMFASMVLSRDASGSYYWNSNASIFSLLYTSTINNFIAWQLTPIQIIYNQTFIGQKLVSGEVTPTDYTLYEDGSSVVTSGTYTGTMSSSSTNAFIGQKPNATNRHDGKFQELIHWPSDKSSNRTDIEDNLNGHFQIY